MKTEKKNLIMSTFHLVKLLLVIFWRKLVLTYCYLRLLPHAVRFNRDMALRKKARSTLKII
jgi:hypothetical protein